MKLVYDPFSKGLQISKNFSLEEAKYQVRKCLSLMHVATLSYEVSIKR